MNVIETPWLLLGLVVCLFAGAGCAGRDFPQPSYDKLNLGSTTRAEVIAMEGPPSDVRTTVTNGVTMQTDVYKYGQAGTPSTLGTSAAGRAMHVSYYNDRIVSYSYVSLFVSEQRRIETSQVAKIEKDKTSGAELLQMLGSPWKAAIFPAIDDKGIRRLVWESRSGVGLGAALTVTLDDHDVVRSVDYSEIKPR